MEPDTWQLADLPTNGLAIFSGNVSQKDNVQDFQVFWVEPPEPVPLKLYRCEQRFVTAPLEEMDAFLRSRRFLFFN
mgnify:CR=1 FL=1